MGICWGSRNKPHKQPRIIPLPRYDFAPVPIPQWSPEERAKIEQDLTRAANRIQQAKDEGFGRALYLYEERAPCRFCGGTGRIKCNCMTDLARHMNPYYACHRCRWGWNNCRACSK